MKQDYYSLEYLANVASRLFKRLGIDGQFTLTEDALDFHHGIWAEKCEIERQTLANIIKVPGFAVGKAVHVSGHGQHPDDVDLVETGQYDNALQAAKAMAELYYQEKVEREAEIVGIDLDLEENPIKPWNIYKDERGMGGGGYF